MDGKKICILQWLCWIDALGSGEKRYSPIEFTSTDAKSNTYFFSSFSCFGNIITSMVWNKNDLHTRCFWMKEKNTFSKRMQRKLNKDKEEEQYWYLYDDHVLGFIFFSSSFLFSTYVTIYRLVNVRGGFIFLSFYIWIHARMIAFSLYVLSFVEYKIHKYTVPLLVNYQKKRKKALNYYFTCFGSGKSESERERE